MLGEALSEGYLRGGNHYRGIYLGIQTFKYNNAFICFFPIAQANCGLLIVNHAVSSPSHCRAPVAVCF